MKNTSKPMLFKTEMVTAILDKTKNQTRRIIKPRNPEMSAMMMNIYCGVDTDKYIDELLLTSAPYKKDDIIWIREAWNFSDDLNNPYWFKQHYNQEYKAEHHKGMKWKPSIHMPKEACRIFLKVLDVRVELLQDISESDSICEGIERIKGRGYKDYLYYKEDLPRYCVSPDDSYKTLWQSINGMESWDDNPLVWVIEFQINKIIEVFA